MLNFRTMYLASYLCFLISSFNIYFLVGITTAITTTVTIIIIISTNHHHHHHYHHHHHITRE